MGLRRTRIYVTRLKLFSSSSSSSSDISLFNCHLPLQTLPLPPPSSNPSSLRRLSSATVSGKYVAPPFFGRLGLGSSRGDRFLGFSFASLHCSPPRFCGDEKVSQPVSRFAEAENQGRVIPVKAYFSFTSVDLKGLQAQNAFNIVFPASRLRNYVVLRYYDDDLLIKSDPQVTGFDLPNENNCRYVVVFQYGSIVLFNVSEHEADGYLKIVEKHASSLLPEMTKDDYAIVEMPSLKEWMQGGLDHIMLRNLSIDGIRTIGSVLGQSIALDYYIRQVDAMVEQLRDIDYEMKKTGTCRMKNKISLQLMGKASCNLDAVILKLKLLERPDIAWKDANYAQIWEYLRNDYELTQRFGSLELKLKFVERNMRFLQKFIQNRKIEYLEWLIVILLALDILIVIFKAKMKGILPPHGTL